MVLFELLSFNNFLLSFEAIVSLFGFIYRIERAIFGFYRVGPLLFIAFSFRLASFLKFNCLASSFWLGLVKLLFTHLLFERLIENLRSFWVVYQCDLFVNKARDHTANVVHLTQGFK